MASSSQGRTIPVGISARHVHLSAADLTTLFGVQAELHVLKDLSQTGQFAAKELVMIAGPKGAIPNVRVLGPVRRRTQIEVSRTDCFQLGVPPVVRNSGDVDETPGIVLIGPNGSVSLSQGTIVAMRHLHMSPSEAKEFGLADGDVIRVGVPGERALIFDQIVVRVDPTFNLELHLDTDEANGAGLKNGALVAVLPQDFALPDLFPGLGEGQPEANQRGLPQ